MALQITYTDDYSMTYNDSYHVATVDNYKPQEKNIVIVIRPYKDQDTRILDFSYCISGKTYSVTPTEDDFDAYFDDKILEGLGVTLSSQVYIFLKSIDLEEEDSPYAGFRFDYKNDSISID